MEKEQDLVLFGVTLMTNMISTVEGVGERAERISEKSHETEESRVCLGNLR